MDTLTAWQNGLPLLSHERGEETQLLVTETSDRHLVTTLQAGDEAAFELIFERHKRLVASVAGRFFSRPEQVEEIIQVTFTKAYFEFKAFRGEHDLSLPSWLSRIAANACLDMLRKKRRKPEDLVCELSNEESVSLLDLAVDDKQDSEETHINRDLAEKLLSRLAAEDRAVLQMLHAEEMSVAEIARVMNWSQSKVKLRAWRARGHLRKILKRYL